MGGLEVPNLLPLHGEQLHVGRLCAAASSVFEAFLAKRAFRRVLRVRQRTPKSLTLTLTKQALSLRFNRKEFCEELYVHRKTPPLIIFVGSQAAFFTAG